MFFFPILGLCKRGPLKKRGKTTFYQFLRLPPSTLTCVVVATFLHAVVCLITENHHISSEKKPLEDSGWIFEVCNMPFVWHIRSHLPCWRQSKKVISMKRNQMSRSKKKDFPVKITFISKQGTKQAGVQRKATKSFKVSLHQTLSIAIGWNQASLYPWIVTHNNHLRDLLCSIRLIQNLKGHSQLFRQA